MECIKIRQCPYCGQKNRVDVGSMPASRVANCGRCGRVIVKYEGSQFIHRARAVRVRRSPLSKLL